MNLEVDKIYLEIEYRSCNLQGLLKVKLGEDNFQLTFVDFLLTEYDDLKEICREDGNTFKYIKHERFSKLANLKIKYNIAEIPIVETPDEDKYAIKEHPMYNDITNHMYYSSELNAIVTNVPIINIHKKSLWRRFLDFFNRFSNRTNEIYPEPTLNPVKRKRR